MIRHVSKLRRFSYDRKRIMLEENDVMRGLDCEYVDTYAFLEERSKGRSLPCKISDMDPPVAQAAITDNTRLGAVPEHIKQMQDAAPPKPKVRTTSEKKPNGRRPGRGSMGPWGSLGSSLSQPLTTGPIRASLSLFIAIPPS